MQSLPVELLRYVGSSFLSDRDRLALAQVNRTTRQACRRDVDHVILDDIVDVRGKIGFSKSPSGYWHAPEPLPGVKPHPLELGCLGATDPYAFLRAWLHISAYTKCNDFRRQCIQSMALHHWHEEIMLTIKILRSRRPRAPDRQLLRRALWYCRTEVACHLLDCGMAVDASDGAALSLALSTLGHNRPEEQVAELVLQLLIRGANPTRHNFWGLRVSLHLNYHVVAGLLCAYSMKVTGGETKLVALVNEFENRDLAQHADLIRASAGFFYLV